ncbi:hypothetical protein DYB32_004082 [Aphanomyces invadans]|uniref:PUM-HD domain-containing protein n=1 Tax=Aphanomyces invadans TaxID=157072 RepID=A0A3R7AAA0_9STRA|nr:hypothetical protein DYB32_004082 [Aphanomyces invadans]
MLIQMTRLLVILQDSSMLYYDHPASFPSTNVGTPVFPNRRRKNSIEMFLSRSPSQHLGSDFFKLAMDDPSDFSLDDTSNEGPSVDPFGNYLFQKLLECGTESQRFAIVQQVAHHLVAAALNLHGTRSVQKVVEICSSSSMPQLVELIVDALKDDAVRLCIDSNGNHVIQRALQYMPATYNQFVFDAVSAECTVVGTHRHGCCVLQRCVDAANPAQRREVIAQVEKHAMKLMQDPYGNYVVQYVLDACSTADVVGVMTKCVGHVLELSIQKFSSNVIEKCLELAPDYLCQTFVREIIASPRMHRMLQDQYANYVVQRALSVASDENCLDLVTAMRPHLTSMKNTQGGRRIQARILKRFPHLDVGWDPDFADLAAGSPATGPRQPSIPHHSGGSYGRVA